MDGRTPKGNGRKLVVIGLASMAVLFAVYSRYQSPEMLTPDAIEPIQRIAYGFYAALLAAFGAVAYGVRAYHVEKAFSGGRDLLSVVARTTLNSKSRRIFAATFVGYGVFFSLASGTLVYQPEVNFAIHYGADIPSGFVAPCCGDPGYMPKIIVYLTEHVGLQVIPVNLVLQVVVSYLVGLNAAVAASAYSISKKGRGASTVGAAAGLFIACPTCAGTFSSIFIGTASGIALTAALVHMQTAFIAVSIPVLLVTPLLMAKKIRLLGEGCAPDSAP